MSKRRMPAPAVARTRSVRRRRALETAEAAVLFGVLVFLLGGYWDVGWHITVGRETFWSPPHLLLYSGILLILATCAYAFVRAWRAGRKVPGPGPFIAAMGAALALASAPIDDLWHRLYGLDVTILSPPHVMLVAGMAVAAFGALAGFALRANRRDPTRLDALWRSTGGRWAAAGDETGLLLAGGVLAAVVLAVLGEYDFDVSRYPVTWHPVLLGTLAAFALTLAARVAGRAGAATLTAAAYTGVRLLAFLELWALGVPRPQIPLVLLAAPALDVVIWRLSLATESRLDRSANGTPRAATGLVLRSSFFVRPAGVTCGRRPPPGRRLPRC